MQRTYVVQKLYIYFFFFAHLHCVCVFTNTPEGHTTDKEASNFLENTRQKYFGLRLEIHAKNTARQSTSLDRCQTDLYLAPCVILSPLFSSGVGTGSSSCSHRLVDSSGPLRCRQFAYVVHRGHFKSQFLHGGRQ